MVCYGSHRQWRECYIQKTASAAIKKRLGKRQMFAMAMEGGLIGDGDAARGRTYTLIVVPLRGRTWRWRGKWVTKPIPELPHPSCGRHLSEGGGETGDGWSATKRWRESSEEPEGGIKPGADGGRGEKSSGACQAINVTARAAGW